MRNAKKHYSRNTPYRRAQAASGATGGEQHSIEMSDPPFCVTDNWSGQRVLELDVNNKLDEAVESYKKYSNKVSGKPRPLNRDLWVSKVTLSNTQAMVSFLADGTIHIGFFTESYKNTSLPYTYPTEKIFAHVARNKGDKSIPDEDCLNAIQILKWFLVGLQQIRDLDSEKLQKIASRLYQTWAVVDRHMVTLTVSGALAKAGYSSKQVQNLFRALYCNQDDAELKEVLAYVASAFQRYREGRPLLRLEILKQERYLAYEVIEELIELLT